MNEYKYCQPDCVSLFAEVVQFPLDFVFFILINCIWLKDEPWIIKMSSNSELKSLLNHKVMEHSLNLSSSMGKGVSSATATENTCCPEESGWTSYFQDLSQGMMEQSYCSGFGSDSGGGSSLVSDAASCAAWKFSHQNNNQNHNNSSNNHLVSGSPVRNSSNLPRKLCFKKTRAKQISDDDPLEDTASSPVNSPKVGDLMNPTVAISRKIDDQLDGSKGKGFKSGHYSELQTDEENVNNGMNNIDCSDLKKRGYCLVPLSMLVNYFG